MKKLMANDYAMLLARMLLGFIFLVASIEKLDNPDLFAGSIMNYRMVPHGVALGAATVLPWVELLCALGLIFGIGQRGASLLILAMLVVFTLAVGSAMARNLDISCGCFTQDPAAGKVGWLKLGEDVLMLLVSVFLFFSSGARFTLERYLHGPTDG
jgi:uncharacterized membrane protein YphA (DoxX/SURF4 family)